MGHICSTPRHRIPAICSAASIQEELVERSGQSNSSITGSCITVDTLQFRDVRKWIELIGLIAALPLMYFVMYVAYKLLSWLEILQKCQQKSRNICQSLQQKWRAQNFRQQELCDEEQLPDRIVNPCEYQQLSQNMDSDENSSETDNLPTIGAYTNDDGSIQQ